MNIKKAMYNKLKYGSVFVCKCGSQVFILTREIHDRLDMRNGRIRIYLSDLSELAVNEYDRAYCANCGARIGHKKVNELLERWGKDIEYIVP